MIQLPFFWISLAFTSGIIFQKSAGDFLTLNFWPGWLYGIALLFLIRGRRGFLLIFMIVMTLTGYLWAERHTAERQIEKQSWGFLKERAEKNIFNLVEGRVLTPPETKSRGRKRTVSFELQVEKVLSKEQGRFRSHAAEGRLQVFLFQPPILPSCGDKVRLYGSLGRAAPALNPGEFDYSDYLDARGIHALFRGYGRSVRILEPSGPGGIFSKLGKLRGSIQYLIRKQFLGDSGAVMQALVTGDQKNISDRLRDDFAKSGTSHLLAVSGLNLTLVAGTLFGALLFIRVPGKAAALISLIAIFVYASVAGFGTPVVRAAWMSSAALTAIMLEREGHTLNAFFLALFILVLADPDALRGIGFQLSFLSVLGLLIFLKRSEQRIGWQDLFRGTLAAMAMTTPVVIQNFHLFSLSALLANLLAIPIFHLALLSGLMAVVTFGWAGLSLIWVHLAERILDLGLDWIHCLAQMPLGYWYPGTPSLVHMIAYYVSGHLAFSLGHSSTAWIPEERRTIFKKMAWGLWGILALLMILPMRPQPELVIFSSGKSEMVYFGSNSGKHFLLNTGRSFPSSQARWTLMPFLRSRAVHHLDEVILADSSAKYSGGLSELSQHFKISRVSTGRMTRNKYRKMPYRISELRTASTRALAPGLKLKTIGTPDSSPAFLFYWQSVQFLYVPKLDEVLLASMPEQHRLMKDVRFLFLGSEALLDLEKLDRFLEWVDPECAVMLGGHPETADLLKAREISIFNLEEQGALIMLTDGIRNDRRVLISGYQSGPVHFQAV